MNCETHPVIPHFIEEVLDFKQFVDGYLDKGGDFLEGHSKSGRHFYVSEERRAEKGEHRFGEHIALESVKNLKNLTFSTILGFLFLIF